MIWAQETTTTITEAVTGAASFDWQVAVGTGGVLVGLVALWVSWLQGRRQERMHEASLSSEEKRHAERLSSEEGRHVERLESEAEVLIKAIRQGDGVAEAGRQWLAGEDAAFAAAEAYRQALTEDDGEEG